jgi:hypothetical protein
MKSAGVPRFAFRKVTVPGPVFRTTARCMLCSTKRTLRRGDWSACFTIGQEIVGLVCDSCLDADSRVRVAQLRRSAARGVAEDDGDA